MRATAHNGSAENETAPPLEEAMGRRLIQGMMNLEKPRSDPDTALCAPPRAACGSIERR